MNNNNQQTSSPSPIQDSSFLPPPTPANPSTNPDSTSGDKPSVSIVEQLAQMATKSEIVSLLKFKEEQQIHKDDPLWAFLIEFKIIENAVNKQEEVLNLLINGFDRKLTQQIESNQQRIDTSFNTYSQDLVNQYKALTDNLKTVESASLNLTQAKISTSVSNLVRHAAHTKAVSDWKTMSRLGVYIFIPMILAAVGGWFGRSYFDYRYSNSGLSNKDTALLHWAKSEEGKLAKNLAIWNNRGLTLKGKSRICEQEVAQLDITLKLEGKPVDRGWCALWMLPPEKR